MKREQEYIVVFLFILVLLVPALALPGQQQAKGQKVLTQTSREDVMSPQPAAEVSLAVKKRIGFALRLHGGMNYLQGGQLNEGIAGFVQRYEQGAESAGRPYESVSDPLHLCYEAGADLLVFFGPRFGLSLGAAYLKGRQQSGVDITWPLYTFTVDFNREVEAIPVTLGLFYHLPLGKKFNLVFEAGGGYTFARLYMEQLAAAQLEYSNQYSTGRAGGLNFYARLGLEARMTRGVFIFAETLGRVAKISNFRGSAKLVSSSSPDESFDGAFFFFDLDHQGRLFHILDFGVSAWDNPEVSNAVLAEIDFSGVSVRAGVRFRF
ncbi:MAG: hypothetical protein JXI33_06385 [Candidatus Aminicenantes bacterium]|nr:hypothetical protein [Candidatus Aminicenantes bacterium]